MELIGEHQALWATIIGLVLLLLLILRWRVNAFMALLGCAIIVGLLSGMSPELAFKTVQNGMGGTLGFIAPVIGLGAIFGALMEQSGAVSILAQRMEGIKTDKRKSFAVGLMGLIAAIPVFFDVALIILLPFVMKLARKAGKTPLYFGLPLCAGLAIGHAFIPPTPGPIAIASLIGANLGQVIVVGMFISVICLVVAGPILTIWLDKTHRLPVAMVVTGLVSDPLSAARQEGASAAAPSFSLAICLMLLPIGLIMAATLARLALPESGIQTGIEIIGHPFSALILACIASQLFMPPKTEADRTRRSDALSRAFAPTAVVILVTGAGGAFKQILVDTGAGADMANYFLSWNLSPVFLAFLLALIIRAVQGSATVAMITAAGLMAPIITGISPNGWQLAVLTAAIASGATGLSHVNDSGFWLVSRLFNLTEDQTLKSWTVMTSVIAVTGLLICLPLYYVLG